jgi:hypothetical protein
MRRPPHRASAPPNMPFGSFTRVQTHYLGEVHSLLHYHGQRSENSSCDSALPSMEVSKLR